MLIMLTPIDSVDVFAMDVGKAQFGLTGLPQVPKKQLLVHTDGYELVGIRGLEHDVLSGAVMGSQLRSVLERAGFALSLGFIQVGLHLFHHSSLVLLLALLWLLLLLLIFHLTVRFTLILFIL